MAPGENATGRGGGMQRKETFFIVPDCSLVIHHIERCSFFRVRDVRSSFNSISTQKYCNSSGDARTSVVLSFGSGSTEENVCSRVYLLRDRSRPVPCEVKFQCDVDRTNQSKYYNFILKGGDLSGFMVQTWYFHRKQIVLNCNCY